jgi:hypothetical protein
LMSDLHLKWHFSPWLITDKKQRQKKQLMKFQLLLCYKIISTGSSLNGTLKKITTIIFFVKSVLIRTFILFF